MAVHERELDVTHDASPTRTVRTAAYGAGQVPAWAYALQRSAGNAAVQRVITVQRLSEAELYDLRKKGKEHAFIRGVLGTFEHDGFRYPAQSQGDGIMGRNTISASSEYRVPKSDKFVAYHVNFMISAGSMTKTGSKTGLALTLKLSKLHLTARGATSQTNLVEDGPSILTAERSIHCGPGNDWDWTKPNARNLATELGVDVGDLKLGVLNSRLGRESMAKSRGALQAKIDNRVQVALPGCAVTFDNDSTWR
jgi:hypothetical protein